MSISLKKLHHFTKLFHYTLRIKNMWSPKKSKNSYQPIKSLLSKKNCLSIKLMSISLKKLHHCTKNWWVYLSRNYILAPKFQYRLTIKNMWKSKNIWVLIIITLLKISCNSSCKLHCKEFVQTKKNFKCHYSFKYIPIY